MSFSSTWPPPYQGDVMAPAGEPASAGWSPPATAQLDWMHKALQVLFMGLALVGLFVLAADHTSRDILRGAARKHAVAS